MSYLTPTHNQQAYDPYAQQPVYAAAAQQVMQQPRTVVQTPVHRLQQTMPVVKSRPPPQPVVVVPQQPAPQGQQPLYYEEQPQLVEQQPVQYVEPVQYVQVEQ